MINWLLSHSFSMIQCYQVNLLSVNEKLSVTNRNRRDTNIWQFVFDGKNKIVGKKKGAVVCGRLQNV